ncbi:UNVERIFIED_CONTAM: hypothetical protein K2H54_053490 [Gekko kuhli]
MEIPSRAITTLTSLSTGPPRARRVLPAEQAAGAAAEEAGPAQGAHDPVIVVSSPEGSPEDVQQPEQPDPAAVMQVVEERLRTMEAGMVDIRRTWGTSSASGVAGRMVSWASDPGDMGMKSPHYSLCGPRHMSTGQWTNVAHLHANTVNKQG